jgi:uncharacterized protein (TIGR02145 family)
MKTIRFFLSTVMILTIIAAMSICHGCREETTGGMSGIITDTLTSLPVSGVHLSLRGKMDTDSTGPDGKFSFENLNEGVYTVEASKKDYLKRSKSVIVTAGSTAEANILMMKNPLEIGGKYVDFGSESLTGSFTIRNSVSGTLSYTISANMTWASFSVTSGESAGEADTVKVIINRSGLPLKKIIGRITVTSTYGTRVIIDTVYACLNGVLDKRDNKYYGVVKIGNQTWMSENLNTGAMHFKSNTAADSVYDDGHIEKYCLDNIAENCSIYGGLYSWAEMMQYAPADNGAIGTTRGVCPEGWHIPTFTEWETLIFFLGGYTTPGYSGYFGVGDKLKETGSVHWKVPNSGATNETGFTALPGGSLEPSTDNDYNKNLWTFNPSGSKGNWMTSERGVGISIIKSTDSHVGDVLKWTPMGTANGKRPYAGSVRCIKN